MTSDWQRAVFGSYGLGLEVAWKSSLVLLVAGALHLAFRNRWPLFVSSGWNAVLVSLAFLPFAVCMPPLQVDYRTDPVVDSAGDPVVKTTVKPEPAYDSMPRPRDWLEARSEIVSNREATAVADARASRSSAPPIATWKLLAWTYAFGVLFVGIRLLLSFYRLRQMLGGCRTVTGSEWTAVVIHWRTVLNIRRRVRVCHSPDVAIPFTLGVWRPTIVLSSKLFHSASHAEREVIVMHELTHVARWDYAWQWLLRTLQVVYWFQPMLWMAGRQIGDVRERVCDLFCVGTLGNRQQYVDVLLGLVQTISRPLNLGLGLAMARVPRISKRLDAIATSRGLTRNRPTSLVSAAMLCGIALGCLLLGAGVVDVIAETRVNPGDKPGRPNDEEKSPVRDASTDEIRSTDKEQRARARIKEVVGRQFGVNKHNAVLTAALGGHKLTDELAHDIADLENLQTLYLHRTEITDAGLKALSDLTQLKALYIGETAIGDAGLEHLRSLNQLKTLHLGQTKVTSAGLRHLRGLNNLRLLHLFQTEVDDAGLAHLHGLSKLEAVSLGSTRVTDEGVKKLQQALPKVVIHGKPQWLVDHPEAAKQLSVAIAVPRRDSRREIDIRRPQSHFDVVVTNISGRELRLWETWNSWGYYNLTLNVVDDDGDVSYTVTKKPRGWTRNFPTWVTLKPGEHFVLPVDFDPKTWGRDDVGAERRAFVPLLSLMRSKPVFHLRLQAVFRILPDEETIEHGIWTGTVRSKPDDFVIRHTPRQKKVEDAKPATPQVDVRSSDGEVLIPGDAIRSYDWTTHTLTLKPTLRAELRKKLKGRLVPGIPFSFTVGGTSIYKGTLTTHRSSFSFATPVIALDGRQFIEGLNEDQLRIELGYPTPQFFKGEDPRADARIWLALKASDTLRPRRSEATVIELAAPAMFEKFPESFEKYRPYHAKLTDGVWRVHGTIPPATLGGTPIADVRDADGVVTRVLHAQ